MIVKTGNDTKKLIISHIADVDGVSSVILGKVHFGKIDYCLVEFSELEDLLIKLTSNDDYMKYDEIFITDISIRTGALELIQNNEELKKRIRHFDHHISELGVGKNYSFVNVVNDNNGVLECGATLFYKYIEKDFKYKSGYLDKYLEAVRSYDTGGPLGSSQYGIDITTLYALISKGEFINKFVSGIINGKDPITKKDRKLIDDEHSRIDAYVKKCDDTLIRINLNGYNVGVSISESYRSTVGNRLSLKYKDELDYIMIINFMRNQFSLRTVRDDIDLSIISREFTKDGGGHKKAAGMPINSDTLFILDIVKEALLKKEHSKKLRIE